MVHALSPLKRIHLQFICAVATDANIPRIWLEVCWAPSKAAALAVLSKYLWEGREVFRRDLFGYTDMLYVCGALFMFMLGNRFANPCHNPDFPARVMYLWMTRQGGRDVGENFAYTEGTITDQDGDNVRPKDVTTATRTKISVVVGPLTTATEMGTHAYVLH